MQHATEAAQHAAETQQQLAEAEQELKQQLSRQIQLCQRLLSHTHTDGNELMRQSINDLRALAEALEQQLPEQ